MTARVSFADQAKRLGVALGWILLFVVIGVGVTIVLSWLVPGWGGREWFLARNGAYELIGCAAATVLVGRVIDKHSWDALGWRTDGRLAPRLARGVGLGALMAATAIGLAIVLDRASVHATHDWSGWPGIALPLVLGLVCAALAEELLFRGYPLRRLAEAVGPAPAMAVLAVLFGLAHVANPSATLFSTVNVALAAVWLSVAFFSSGGMALAWGLHFGWNAGLALLFDAPVSGLALAVPGVDYSPGAHAWVDGGAFGPEGGAVTTIVMIAGTLAIIGARFKQPRTWLAA
jgi:membrane protease YdiL (CAAX protease family)